jgi:hypothetical protein
MRVGLLASLLVLGLAGSLPEQTQPLLQLQGLPHSGASLARSLSGTAADGWVTRTRGSAPLPSPEAEGIS